MWNKSKFVFLTPLQLLNQMFYLNSFHFNFSSSATSSVSFQAFFV